MKISKSVLKAVSLGVVVSLTTVSCQEKTNLGDDDLLIQKLIQKQPVKKTPPAYDCPACGMG